MPITRVPPPQAIHKNGKTHTYWLLVRSVRVGGKVRQEVVARLGKLDAKGRSRAQAYANKLTGRRMQPSLFEPHVLAPALMASARARELFVREARALARLAHPHVVAVYEVFDEPELCAYAMEWVDGTTLARAIEKRDPRLDATAVAQLGAVLAGALSAVHAAGLVHRDIKPGNVLLRHDGAPLLSDFGLVHDAASAAQTTEGQFVGTVAYAAPEQLRGEQASIGPWSDVFSLGVTLYQTLAGNLPFGDGSTTAILGRMAQGDWPNLRKVNRSVPRDLATIVAMAMAAEPAARYPTADALAADLERFLRREPIAARPAGVRLRLMRWIQRRPDLSLALGAAVLLLFAGLFVSVVLLQQARADRDAAERRQYTAAIAAAEAALRHSDSPSAREHLEGAPMALRHWEWRYLASRIDNGTVIGRHARPVTRLAASPDGTRLASAAADRYVRVWDTATGAELAGLEHPEAPLSIAWSGDGTLLVTGCDTKLCVFDATSWSACGAWRVDDPVAALAVESGAGRLAVGHRSGRIGVHALQALLAAASSDAMPDLPAAPVRFRSSGEVHDLGFSVHGHLAASTMQKVHVWDVVADKVIAELTTPDNNWGLCWHPGGERLAAGGGDGAVRVWGVRTGTVHRVCHGHSGRVFGIAWDAAGTRLASAATDRTIRLWNADGRQIAVFLGHADTVASVAFLPQDRLASAGSGATDASVRIWEIDAEHGELQRAPYGFFGTWIEPGPDSTWFPYFGGLFTVIGGRSIDRIAHWDGSSWSPLGSTVGSGLSGGSVLCLAAMPDGALVAGGEFVTAGGRPANHIALWDGVLWSPLGSGLDDVVLAVTMLPDGRVVAGGEFLAAGGVPANRVAAWDGTAWAPLGSGSASRVTALSVRAGTLYAGGSFWSPGLGGYTSLGTWNGSAWTGVWSFLGVEVSDLATTPNDELLIAVRSDNYAAVTPVRVLGPSGYSVLTNG